MSSYSKVRAEDGTMLRAWTNDGTGIPVVISNGLGASPTAWPALAAPDSGFRVVTWHHRGLGGSERPARAGAIRVEDFASDLGAVMASAGMEQRIGRRLVIRRECRLRVRSRTPWPNRRPAGGRRCARRQPGCDVWADENAQDPSESQPDRSAPSFFPSPGRG